MPSSVSIPAPRPLDTPLRSLWTLTIGTRLRGLVLVRERLRLLAWDENNWLYLLSHKGERQAQYHTPGGVAAVCCADDGSAYAAVGTRGEIWWLAPDLMPRWQKSLPHPAVAAALDPFGQYLAVSDAGGNLRVFDRLGRPVSQTQTPRPLHHLAFVPEAPLLLGTADIGLLAAFDLSCNCLWRDGLVATIGALAVSGSGDRIVLACYSEGLRFYNTTGHKQGHLNLSEPSRLAALSFDGQLAVVAGLGERLLVIDRGGKTMSSVTLDKPAVALAVAPLGEWAGVALPDGRVLGLDLQETSSSG
jgi:WD40 repeat protein